MTGRYHGRLPVRLALWRAVILAGIVALGLVWGGCQQPVTPVAGVELGATVDEVVSDPQRFVGRRVAIEAGVAQVVDEHVVVLQSQTAEGGQMLAILSEQAARNIQGARPGDALHVAGVVQPLTREQIRQAEQQLGITLDEAALVSLAGQAPFVIVDSASR